MSNSFVLFYNNQLILSMTIINCYILTLDTMKNPLFIPFQAISNNNL